MISGFIIVRFTTLTLRQGHAKIIDEVAMKSFDVVWESQGHKSPSFRDGLKHPCFCFGGGVGQVYDMGFTWIYNITVADSGNLRFLMAFVSFYLLLVFYVNCNW